VLLAVVAGQPGRLLLLAGEGGEQAAGVDLGQLRRVPDEQGLAAGGGGAGEEPVELAGAEHARLVEDDQAVGG
jgi:hypothetical protein